MALLKPTRRAFVQGLMASGCAVANAGKENEPVATLYEASAGCINIMRLEVGHKRRIQTVPSACPSGFAIDASRGRLFVANDIAEYQGLPVGSVESYAIDPVTGCIELIDRRALALSATHPKTLAISPDGRHLVVAAYGGGIYNVLRVQADGQLGQIIQVFKEIGSGLHREMQATAHPHSVVFHASGKFVAATDFGADRISLFAFEDGRLRRLEQIDAPPGSGPAGLKFSSDGRSVLVKHELRLFCSRYRFSAASFKVTPTTTRW